MKGEKEKRRLDDVPLNEIDEVWIAEAERRYEEWKAGRTDGVEGERFFPDLRRELGCAAPGAWIVTACDRGLTRPGYYRAGPPAQ